MGARCAAPGHGGGNSDSGSRRQPAKPPEDKGNPPQNHENVRKSGSGTVNGGGNAQIDGVQSSNN